MSLVLAMYLAFLFSLLIYLVRMFIVLTDD